MSTQFRHTEYDAIIIGARCAGAATAMLLARAGAKVLIVDRESRIGDTLSTHALMRPAVSLLHQWGLLPAIEAAGTPVVSQTHFVYGSEKISVNIKRDGEIAGLYAPRRWLLDGLLCRAAIVAGAELHLGTNLVSMINDQNNRVTGACFRQADGTLASARAQIVIGADGRRSSVAKMVNARHLVGSEHRYATAYTYLKDIPNEGYRWYFAEGAFGGLIPTTDGGHCLFASCAPEAFAGWFKDDAYDGAMKMLSIWEPALAHDLAKRGLDDRMRRFPGAPGHIRACSGPGWALVGDAGYFKDPATAHGITDAFLDADRLAAALIRTPGSAESYQAQRDRFALEIFSITQHIASRNWDFNRLKTLHKSLATCMKAEHAAMVESRAGIKCAA